MIKSKRNLARRQRRLEERLDRRWQPQRERPVLESGNILALEITDRSRLYSLGVVGDL